MSKQWQTGKSFGQTVLGHIDLPIWQGSKWRRRKESSTLEKVQNKIRNFGFLLIIVAKYFSYIQIVSFLREKELEG